MNLEMKTTENPGNEWLIRRNPILHELAISGVSFF